MGKIAELVDGRQQIRRTLRDIDAFQRQLEKLIDRDRELSEDLGIDAFDPNK